MSHPTPVARLNPNPALDAIQDELLYSAAQARQALRLGLMAFIKAVRKGLLTKTRRFGVAENLYRGSHIKACARRMHVRATLPRFVASRHRYDGPDPA